MYGIGLWYAALGEDRSCCRYHCLRLTLHQRCSELVVRDLNVTSSRWSSSRSNGGHIENHATFHGVNSCVELSSNTLLWRSFMQRVPTGYMSCMREYLDNLSVLRWRADGVNRLTYYYTSPYESSISKRTSSTALRVWISTCYARLTPSQGPHPSLPE